MQHEYNNANGNKQVDTMAIMVSSYEPLISLGEVKFTEIQVAVMSSY